MVLASMGRDDDSTRSPTVSDRSNKGAAQLQSCVVLISSELKLEYGGTGVLQAVAAGAISLPLVMCSYLLPGV